MREGDFVVYVADPWRFGNLIVSGNTSDGKLIVQDSAGELHTLHPFDLELEEVWAEGQASGAIARWEAAA
jgi:hypothetical protein